MLLFDWSAVQKHHYGFGINCGLWELRRLTKVSNNAARDGGNVSQERSYYFKNAFRNETSRNANHSLMTIIHFLILLKRFALGLCSFKKISCHFLSWNMRDNVPCASAAAVTDFVKDTLRPRELLEQYQYHQQPLEHEQYQHQAFSSSIPAPFQYHRQWYCIIVNDAFQHHSSMFIDIGRFGLRGVNEHSKWILCKRHLR